MKIALFVFFILIASCDNSIKQKVNSDESSNSLQLENNPYFLQHKDNLAKWNLWNEKTFLQAEKEDKLLIISIGYSSCHWCHVMEEENFMDKEVASLMNTDYISILIDKEERPDLNFYYMNIMTLANGVGGWPLNVIALPNGKPIYVGGYYNKQDWITLLNYYSNLYKKNKKKLIKQSEEITSKAVDFDYQPKFSNDSIVSNLDIQNSFENVLKLMDPNLGGFRYSVKFPIPLTWEYLLKHYQVTHSEKTLVNVQNTLQKIANGGIRDHVGGGFFRYATDVRWKVPHFEKMLYDNALMINVYAQAYSETKNLMYKKTALETIKFLELEMQSSDGAFYTAIDAELKGKEGIYYTWTVAEVDSLLGDDAVIFKDIFGFIPSGNWKVKQNILFYEDSIEEIANRYAISSIALEKKIENWIAILQLERKKRHRPKIDSKIITEWNALMINSYINSYKAFDDNVFLEKAIELGNYLINNTIQKDNSIIRIRYSSTTIIPGYLSDYSNLISGFIALYEGTLDEKWIIAAIQLTEYTMQHFYNSKTNFFYNTSDCSNAYILCQQEFKDEDLPSSNSQMATNLFKLGIILGNETYTQKATSMLMLMKNDIVKSPNLYSNWCQLLLNLNSPPIQVIIVGPDYASIRKEFNKFFLPNTIFYGGKNTNLLKTLEYKIIPNKTNIYICKKETCYATEKSIDEVVKKIVALQKVKN